MITIRRAELQDVPAIQRLISASFEAALHPYIRSTQAGAEWFLQVFVAYPESYPDYGYLLAESERGDVVGFAEFRITEKDTCFLSYICVDPATRGQGVATSLIRSYLDAQSAMKKVQLDVFSDNHPAISLYKKLGFHEDSQTTWLTRTLPTRYKKSPIVFDNLHLSLAMYEKCGFCELHFDFQGQKIKMGRMGSAVLRCFRQEDFFDEDLLGNVADVFPTLNEVFLITAADRHLSTSFATTEVNRSIRMTWELSKSSSGALNE